MIDADKQNEEEQLLFIFDSMPDISLPEDFHRKVMFRIEKVAARKRLQQQVLSIVLLLLSLSSILGVTVFCYVYYNIPSPFDRIYNMIEGDRFDLGIGLSLGLSSLFLLLLDERLRHWYAKKHQLGKE